MDWVIGAVSMKWDPRIETGADKHNPQSTTHQVLIILRWWVFQTELCSADACQKSGIVAKSCPSSARSLQQHVLFKHGPSGLGPMIQTKGNCLHYINMFATTIALAQHLRRQAEDLKAKSLRHRSTTSLKTQGVEPPGADCWRARFGHNRPKDTSRAHGSASQGWQLVECPPTDVQKRRRNDAGFRVSLRGYAGIASQTATQGSQTRIQCLRVCGY